MGFTIPPRSQPLRGLSRKNRTGDPFSVSHITSECGDAWSGAARRRGGARALTALAVCTSALACRRAEPDARPTTTATAPAAATAATAKAAMPSAAAALPAFREHSDLASAVRSVLADSTRVIGFGELHARSDRPGVDSPLGRFAAEVLPALRPRLRQLVVETWAVQPRCGQVAERATAELRRATRRPPQTRDAIAELFRSAQRLGVPTRAMALDCADYQALRGGSDDAIVHMLELTTRQLGERAVAALRDAGPAPALVAVYGGALHNDRFPTAGLEPWSYAAAVESVSAAGYLEIDVITPELAELEPSTASQPWAPLLGQSAKVLSYQRGERSFVLVLPRMAR
jgi:hypothetical protein